MLLASGLGRLTSRFALESLIASAVRNTQCPLQGPVVISGLFRTASGIGESARICSKALQTLGIQHTNVDLSTNFNQIDIKAEHPVEAMPSALSGVLLLHFNAPETVHALTALRMMWPRRWHIIGNWVWELDGEPLGWRTASKFISEIWTPSEYSREALLKATNKRVTVVPYFVRSQQPQKLDRAKYGIEQNEFLVLSMADARSSLHRKNLIGSINVFRNAFGARQGFRLILKTRNLREDTAIGRMIFSAAREDSRITVIDRSIISSEVMELIDCCDVYLSLHRAEGFGLTMAEAMALGKAVIATGWSGNMEYMSNRSAALVSYSLVPALDKSGIYNPTVGTRWAEPDEAEASRLLALLAESPAERNRLGEAARDAINEKLSAKSYANALTKRLKMN